MLPQERGGSEIRQRGKNLRQPYNNTRRRRRGARVTYQWEDCDRSVIAARYDRIAGLIGFIDWLFCVPPDFRRRAARRLALKPGDRVLEIGCGTGRNFANLREAVGPEGQVYGVDLSAGMLARARGLCERHGWTNVEVTQDDAAAYAAPEPLDAVLFGLSYNTMPHHRLVLLQALKQLRPGGRIVIMDGKLPPGLGGRLLLPFSLWLMRSTMLGNPLIKPWQELAAVVDGFAMEEFLFGSWYICWGAKPMSAGSAQLLAAE
jgi:demethylmenaquinone methyltransferase/2-methoxy-6-polyprenyl-1,4-benzoquinol methylase